MKSQTQFQWDSHCTLKLYGIFINCFKTNLITETSSLRQSTKFRRPDEKRQTGIEIMASNNLYVFNSKGDNLKVLNL